MSAGLAAYYTRIGRRVRALVEPLSEEQLWQKPFPYGNSIGHLVLHLTGNMQYYMGARLLESGYVRDRPLEFSDTRRRSKADVLGDFDAAVAVVIQALEAQRDEDWGRPYAAEGVTVEEVPDRFAAFLRSAAHADQHLGQMMYIRKQLELGSGR